MMTMRRQLLGLGFIAASSLVALHAAQAMSGPSAIQIDGGPLGDLQLSGGVDGFGYYLGDSTESGNLPGTSKDLGADIGSGLVELQKTDGELQFTIEVGSNGGTTTLGSGSPGQTSITTFTTGPLYAGYITIAPTGSPVTISAGQIGSLEGYESGIDWNNANQLTTEIFYVQNSQSRGVSATYSQGPISATVTFGDGYDTGAWDFIQGLITYTINPTNSLTVYTADNLGRTGPNTYSYGGGTTGGAPYYVNSDMIGGYYSYTLGNLNLVPEVQYQIAKGDSKLGIGTTDPNTGVFYSKASSNLGVALFGDYSLSSTSPYSVGAWVEYWNSKGTADWFIGSDSEGVGASLTPTWQYKDLFARADAGYIYLLHNKAADGVTTYGYGDNKDHGEFVGELEAGLLF
jgi:hypothetical protein